MTAIFGTAGITASAFIYLVPARPSWNTQFTVTDFFLTGALLGPLFAGRDWRRARTSADADRRGGGFCPIAQSDSAISLAYRFGLIRTASLRKVTVDGAGTTICCCEVPCCWLAASLCRCPVRI